MYETVHVKEITYLSLYVENFPKYVIGHKDSLQNFPII